MKMIAQHALLPFTVCSAMILFGCDADSSPSATTANANAQVGNEIGNLAPNFTLSDAKGWKHSLKEYRGQIIVLDFWATWCEPCTRAMPALQAVHEKYADRQVQVIGIGLHERGDPAKYMKRQGYTYDLLIDGDIAFKPYGERGIPLLVVIGPDGVIAAKHNGYSDTLEQELTREIDRLLKG